MGHENEILRTTIESGADYSSGGQYHAFALSDGQLAANPQEASGILLNKPGTGRFAEIGYLGESKFAAGGAVAKGAKLTITTSGWFVTANSYEAEVGVSRVAVASGGIGTGYFNFIGIRYPQDIWNIPIGACTAGLIAGIAVAIDDLAPANNGEEAAGVAMTAISSGATGNLAIGKVELRIDPAKVCSMGDLLTVTTSGYFTPCDSGYFATARALENIGSNSTGTALFFGTLGYEGA